MAWTGKIIGGVLGSFIGPWGTAIGIGIGHQFDKGAARVQTAGMAMQVAFFGCLAKMARADGTISPQEINAVEQIIARLGYTPRMREAAIEIFRKAKDDSHTAADYLNQLASVIQYNPQIAMTFLAALHAVAQADGLIHPGEREILLQAERAFRLQPGTIDALLGGGRASNLEDACKVLGCSPEMSDAEIKKTYRSLAREYHPDVVANTGMGEDFKQIAAQKMRAVNAAYDTIKDERGF